MKAPSAASGRPLVASVIGDEVVLQGQGDLSGSFTPEAIFDSLRPMRRAAEAAVVNRERHRGRGIARLIPSKPSRSRRVGDRAAC